MARDLIWCANPPLKSYFLLHTDVMRDLFIRLRRNEGARGFYKGIGPNVIRVTPACCITFVVYENVSRLLLGQYK